jgi:hypothetical protein
MWRGAVDREDLPGRPVFGHREVPRRQAGDRVPGGIQSVEISPDGRIAAGIDAGDGKALPGRGNGKAQEEQGKSPISAGDHGNLLDDATLEMAPWGTSAKMRRFLMIRKKKRLSAAGYPCRISGRGDLSSPLPDISNRTVVVILRSSR